MQLDWDKTINDILAEKMACQACGALGDEMIVGYTRNSRCGRVRLALPRLRGQDGLRRPQAGGGVRAVRADVPRERRSAWTRPA